MKLFHPDFDFFLVFSTTIKVSGSGRIISSRSYAAKDISFGVGARAAMLQGVSEVAEAVKVTMGPKVCIFGPLKILINVEWIVLETVVHIQYLYFTLWC